MRSLCGIHSSDCFHIAWTAAGYRNNATGALGNVGTNGEYFSSSPLSASIAQASALWFNSGNVNPLSNPNRANGRSVRCVQHLRSCFFISDCKTDSFRPGVARATARTSAARVDSAIR
jgi:hypothetical protein